MERRMLVGSALGGVAAAVGLALVVGGATEPGEVSSPARGDGPAAVRASPSPDARVPPEVVGERPDPVGLAQGARSLPPIPRPEPGPPTADWAVIDERLTALDAGRRPVDPAALAAELRAEFDALDALDCEEKEEHLAAFVELALHIGELAETTGGRDPDLYKRMERGPVNWYWYLAAGFLVEHDLALDGRARDLAARVEDYAAPMREGRVAPPRLCATHVPIGEIDD